VSVRNWYILIGGIIVAIILAWALFGLFSAGEGPAPKAATAPVTTR
jgi:hypothetical protein